MIIGVILDNEIKKDHRVLNELKSLVETGNTVFVLCPSFDTKLQKEQFNGFEIRRFSISKRCRRILFGINNTFPIYDYIWTREIKKFIHANNIEIVHVHDLYMSRSAYMAIKNSGISMTLDLHENYPEAIKTYTWANSFPKSLLAQPLKWSRLEEKYLSYANNIVSPSESFRDDLLAKYDSLKKKRFAIYPNVPDVKEFLSYPIVPNIIDKGDSFILLYFGVVGIRRGILTCFDALRVLIKQIPEIKLLIIGPVDSADKTTFNTYLSDPELAPHIIYETWKDISLLPSFVSISDICLAPLFKNPQHEAGLANKIFQYMLLGSPLLVSNCKPQADLVNQTNCGLVFKDRDIDDFVSKTLILYNNPELRYQMGQNGIREVKEKYNLEIAGKNISDLYDK